MNSIDPALSLIQYMVFLFSTVCHEAAHALAAKWGGDPTAFLGGQVTLSPWPHIRREPFGMVLMPLLGLFTGTGLIGWASAPFDPFWSQRYPKRAAWMSLAGPMANFTLVIIAAVLMRVGFAARLFRFPDHFSSMHLVQATGSSELMDGAAVFLSVLFSLNILLGTFNLLPIPPLDGFSVLGLFLPENAARKLAELRISIGAYAFIGLLLAWRVFGDMYIFVMGHAVNLLYFGATPN